MPPSLSIFFPAYNDAGTIASLALVAHMTARTVTDDYEVIVVNDCSPDHTGELLDEMARTYPWLKVVHHPKNRGYGGALRSGFASSTKELVFYTDGDAQYDPRELLKLFEALTPEIDFVNGIKIARQDPFHRKIIGRVYHTFVKTMFGLRLEDVDCDFRLMRRRVFEKVALTRSSGVICVELMKKVQDHGYRIAEVPVQHFHRAYGRSQFFNVPRVARTLSDLVNLWFELVWRKEHISGVVEVNSTTPVESGGAQKPPQAPLFSGEVNSTVPFESHAAQKPLQTPLSPVNSTRTGEPLAADGAAPAPVPGRSGGAD